MFASVSSGSSSSASCGSSPRIILLANHSRKLDLMQNYPPEILKSRLDAVGDLEHKVKYVSSIDEEKDAAHFGWEWMMADEVVQVGAYKKAIREFHEQNPGAPRRVGEGVVKVEDQGKKEEGKKMYPNGVPKVDLDTWMNMSDAEIAAHRVEVARVKTKAPAVSRDAARQRKKEGNVRRAVFNFKLAVAQAEFKRTMHTMTREERAHRAEAMVKECL